MIVLLRRGWTGDRARALADATCSCTWTGHIQCLSQVHHSIVREEARGSVVGKCGGGRPGRKVAVTLNDSTGGSLAGLVAIVICLSGEFSGRVKGCTATSAKFDQLVDAELAGSVAAVADAESPEE
jgi:hypothetical protein